MDRPPIHFPAGRTRFTIAEAVRLIGLGENWRAAVKMLVDMAPSVPYEAVSRSKLYDRQAVLQIQERFIAHRLAVFPDKPLPWDRPKGKGGRHPKSGKRNARIVG